MTEIPQELEASVGDKKIRIRGSDILTSVVGMIVCSGLAIMIYSMFEHRVETKASVAAMLTDSKESTAAMLSAVREQVSVQREGVMAQREMNCLIAIAPELRERNSSFCKQLSR